MSNTPLNGNNLPRIAAIGAILAVFGIVLFLVLWAFMGSMGVDSLPRLIVSLCLPPAILAVILGVVILVRRSKA